MDSKANIGADWNLRDQGGKGIFSAPRSAAIRKSVGKAASATVLRTAIPNSGVLTSGFSPANCHEPFFPGSVPLPGSRGPDRPELVRRPLQGRPADAERGLKSPAPNAALGELGDPQKHRAAVALVVKVGARGWRITRSGRPRRRRRRRN